MRRLKTEIHPRSALDEGAIASMFRLYRDYYDATDPDIFRADLNEKDYVVLLLDDVGEVRGFSTLAILLFEFDGQAMRALFSGDTIIHHLYWGEQSLALAWCRLAGAIKAMAPTQPLYWFLISKGDRTYRYLPLFSKQFFPTRQAETPAHYKALMDFLAYQKFGGAYDAERGVVRFPSPRGHLRAEWTRENSADCNKPDVRYFLQKNPGYHQGDELVCLTELALDNLRSHARRAFAESLVL